MVIGRLVHVALAVDDIPSALTFYHRLFGQLEVGSDDGRVFLAGGKGAAFDLSLREGEPMLEHFAFNVASEADLDEARDRLKCGGVGFEEVVPEGEPGVAAGIRFALPSGHLIELVLLVEPQVYTPTSLVSADHHVGAGPVELEHITMTCDDVEQTARFLIDDLDFRLTESVQPPGQPWFNAFLRSRDQHHDVAFFNEGPGAEPGLNHLCFAVPSVADLVRVADIASGLGHHLDASIGRHLAGNNVFLYLKDPAGHRVEVNTDMARIDVSAPPRIVSEMRFDAWRESIAPDVLSFSRARDGRRSAAAKATRH